MDPNAQILIEEHESLRTRIKNLISRLYRENVKNHRGEVMPEVSLTEEWEYEGQEFNAITEQGLAIIVDKKVDELFTWDDLETESLIEVVHILEDKEFADC